MNPILIKKKLETSNTRTDAKGFNSFHACPTCEYENPIRSRTVQHMLRCKNKLTLIDKRKDLNEIEAPGYLHIS